MPVAAVIPLRVGEAWVSRTGFEGWGKRGVDLYLPKTGMDSKLEEDPRSSSSSSSTSAKAVLV